MSDERVLGWDDEISNDAASQSIILPAGEYRYEIVDLKRARHTPNVNKPGKLPECPKAILTVRIYTPDGTDHVDLEESLFLHSRCEGILCAFFKSIGQRKHGEPLRPNWGQVVGSKGRCKVSVRDYVVDGDKRQANDVKAFLEPKTNGQYNPPTTVSTPPVKPPAEGGF